MSSELAKLPRFWCVYMHLDIPYQWLPVFQAEIHFPFISSFAHQEI